MQMAQISLPVICRFTALRSEMTRCGNMTSIEAVGERCAAIAKCCRVVPSGNELIALRGLRAGAGGCPDTAESSCHGAGQMAFMRCKGGGSASERLRGRTMPLLLDGPRRRIGDGIANDGDMCRQDGDVLGKDCSGKTARETRSVLECDGMMWCARALVAVLGIIIRDTIGTFGIIPARYPVTVSVLSVKGLNHCVNEAQLRRDPGARRAAGVLALTAALR